MNTLNRLCSPMHPMDENLDDTDTIRQKKIEFIKLRELSKSPYSIGSINDIEKKVSKLEEQIKGYQTNFFDDSDSETDIENSDDTQIKLNINIRKAVAFNKPDRIKKIVKKSMKSSVKSKVSLDDKALPKFIELCQHPGFNLQKLTDLPFLVRIEFILQRVQQAQPLSFVKIYKNFFDKWFYCQEIQNILKDMFWYFFISIYGSDIDKKELNNYFSRAARYYVEFLFKISTESLYYQEKLKKVLPDLLSQSLYAALSECFPDSWIQFNNDFIENIIQLVFFWFSGIRPMKGLWNHWNMQELKPTEQKIKEKVIEKQSHLGFTDAPEENKTSEPGLHKSSTSSKSTLMGVLNHSNNVLFNLNGNSPLIQNYFQKNKFNNNFGTNNLIKHKEILPRIIDDNGETLDLVVSKSLNSLKNREEIYKKFHERNLLETKRFIRLQKINNKNDEKRQEKLLTNKSKVHRLSNLMMHEFLKNKDSISFGADKALADAIMSVE